MARIARVVLPNYPHHVTQRGVRSMEIFETDGDRFAYLRLLQEAAETHGLEVISYCLMANHVHFVVVPKTAQSLAKVFAEAHKAYTRRINFRQNVRGHLFQNRFFSCPLDENYLFAAVRYVERNPVEAGIVSLPWQYKWSSASFHVGEKSANPLVTTPFMPGPEMKSFLLQSPGSDAFLEQRTQTGRPCGDDQFMKLAEKKTKRSLRPKRPGRPKKKQVTVPGKGKKI